MTDRIEFEEFIEQHVQLYKNKLIDCFPISNGNIRKQTEEFAHLASRDAIYSAVRHIITDYVDTILQELEKHKESSDSYYDKIFHNVNDDESFLNALDEVTLALKTNADDDYCDDQCSPSSDDSEYSTDECNCFSLCKCGLFDFDSSDSDCYSDLD